MATRQVVIIEFPSNLGLKEPMPGKEPGVKNLPAWLAQHGLHQRLNAEEVIKLATPGYSSVKDVDTGILNITSLAAYAIQQSGVVTSVLGKRKFPFILGGDCSILLGPALALRQRGNFGLFYLDGHTDFMFYTLSSTGGIGGMAASVVTGTGDDRLTNISGLLPYIKEDNLWCVGNREYDAVYEDQVRNSTATYISLADLRQQTIANCVDAFLDSITTKALDGFWLHIDVDVLDDAVMPCVDSRTPGGLSYQEFNELTRSLFSRRQLIGLEITILDPDLDPTGEHTIAFVANITDTFNAAR